MRRQFLVLVAGILWLIFPRFTKAQTAQGQPPPAVAKNASSLLPASPASSTSASSPSSASPQTAAGSAAATELIQPEQPMTLGELARRERARKSTQPKSVKIFDDENMPRAPISTGEKAPGFADSGSSSSGKVTLLDFWATWCGPCRHALPGLKQIQSVYGSDQLEIISVSEDDDEGAWHNFVAQNQMTWTQRLDADHQMMRQYGASALPTYVLIGKDGAVVNQYVGDDPEVPIIERIGPDLKKSLDGKS
ncbi:MAG TPA: TlpA disulfide reductase family protein [Candidatus Acidoferrales bacterium]|nr:TlpA disulfide reductase family protein [Candidatus Acidoferrales bacterium]